MAAPTTMHVPIHIEARIKPDCLVPRVEVKARIASYLAAHVPVFRPGPLEGYAAADALLGQTLESLVVEVGGGEEEVAVSYWRSVVNVHVFKYTEEDQQPPGGLDFALEESGGNEGVPTAFSVLVCPCKELEGQWESIFVKPATKEVLLAMAAASMHFAMHGVNPTLVSGSRLILLHGEPGTGKSTLARGFAQKLAIRHGDAFTGGVELLAVNAHSLISKFMGESGTRVARVFGHIRERVADEPTSLFICVIDEVETICASREAALARGSTEPGDAVRVVNAVLTEIDRLRAFKNVLIVATSNITGALDAAFLDRCDLRIQVGLPNPEGRYHIIQSTLLELMRAGIVGPAFHLPQRFELLHHSPSQAAQALLRLVELTGLGHGGGLSGRALRKLPLQAFAMMGGTRPPPVPPLEFLGALERAVQGLLEARGEEGSDKQGNGEQHQ